MTRRSKDQRRTDYLDIGAELVAESATPGVSDPGLALAHVKLADVADRAGVTKGALYHIWPSQEVFWHDLLIHLIDSNQLFGADQLEAIGAEVAATSGSPPTLRRFGNALFDSLRTDPSFFARVSLFSYLDDEAVRDELDRSFRAAVERVMPMLEASIAGMGRRLVPGATLWDFAVAIASLLEGLCLQFRISPDRTPDLPVSDGARWSLFSAAAEALLMGYTEPIAAGVHDTGSSEGTVG
jgi:AcrR family transcriptional regulator